MTAEPTQPALGTWQRSPPRRHRADACRHPD